MVGCCKESQRDVWTLPSSDYAVWNARSMTDWVMQAIPKDMHNLSTSNKQPATPWNTRLWSDLTGVAVDNNVDKPEYQSYLHQLLNTPHQGNFSDVVPCGNEVAEELFHFLGLGEETLRTVGKVLQTRLVEYCERQLMCMGCDVRML